MQKTSATYKEIVAGTHWFETKLVIGDEFYLIDEHADYITSGDFVFTVTTEPEPFMPL